MAKGARASVVKKNKSKLKSRVFGPVEMARNERLSAKLLELASQPKPPRQEMAVEKDGQSDNLEGSVQPGTEQATDSQPAEGETKTEDNKMEVDGAAEGSNMKKLTGTEANSDKKRKSGRVQKTRHRRARNEIAFLKHPMKKTKKEKARKG